MLQDSGDLTVSEKLSKLKLVCGSDGVHLKTEGTRNVAKNVKLCKKSAAETSAAALKIAASAAASASTASRSSCYSHCPPSPAFD